MRVILALGAVVILMGGAALALDSKTTRKEAGDVRPDRLSAPTREFLSMRMKDHRVDMESLMRAVIVLDRRKAAVLSIRIAEDASLARPISGQTDLMNAQIPPRFFDLQEELRAAAREVSTAATKGSDMAIAKSFGKLTETCVACHASYLRDP